MNFTSLIIYVWILDNVNNIEMVRGVAAIPYLFRVLNMILRVSAANEDIS